MIPREWKGNLRAPQGKILVERNLVNPKWHGLILPDTYLLHTRTCIATVRNIHHSLGDMPFDLGDVVLIAQNSGRMILLGYETALESEMWVIAPNAVKMKMLQNVTEELSELGESHLRHAKSLDARSPTIDEKWSEGDRHGLR